MNKAGEMAFISVRRHVLGFSKKPNDDPTDCSAWYYPFRSPSGDWGEIGVHHKKDHIKISQFTKLEVLSEGFQRSEN